MLNLARVFGAVWSIGNSRVESYARQVKWSVWRFGAMVVRLKGAVDDVAKSVETYRVLNAGNVGNIGMILSIKSVFPLSLNQLNSVISLEWSSKYRSLCPGSEKKSSTSQETNIDR